MTETEAPDTLEPTSERPANITHVLLPVLGDLTFARRGDGGYDPDDVDSFVKELQTTLDAFENERTALRADVAHLRDRVEDRGHTEIALDAVGLLSQAQLIADKAIADAETYARDLMLTARSQYRQVLERAEASAKEAAQQTQDVHADAAGGVSLAPVREVEYVRTYARVAQVQLRAVLDALAEQIDLLGEVPKSSSGPAAVPSTTHASQPAVTTGEDSDALWAPTESADDNHE